MWKILKINDDSYLVKHEYFEEKYNLHLTNLVNLWHEIIDKKCLLERFKVLINLKYIVGKILIYVISIF